MADHAKPILTDNYTDVLSQIRGRFEDQAKGFDPANTTATNISTDTIRWTSASNKWQKWSGTAWTDLSSLYAINISGNAATATNASTVTNGVYTVGDQTIAGVKTFSSTIQGSISGNAGTVTNGVYTTGDQTINGVKTFNSNTIFNGNLGIGTSSPGYKLTVAGTGGSATVSLLETGVRSWGIRAGGAASGTFDIADFTAGLTRLTLDSSGNLGLGVTPSAWGSNYKVVQISGSSISRNDAVDARLNIGNNVYFDSSNQPRYILSAGATYYRQGFTVPDHAWFTAPSGTAGNPVSFTQAMTLDANGKLILSAANQGIQFADGTTQTTAGINPATAAAGAVGTYALLRAVTSVYIYAGNTFAGSDLRWSSAGGNNSAGPVGTWRCLGQVAGGSANVADYVTLWVRIS